MAAVHQRCWHPCERDRGGHRQRCVFTGDPEGQVGQKVTWTNKQAGRRAHRDRQRGRVQPTDAVGATFSFTLTKAGTFAYHCTIHASMRGKIVVS
jgi:plastocyanin